MNRPIVINADKTFLKKIKPILLKVFKDFKFLNIEEVEIDKIDNNTFYVFETLEKHKTLLNYERLNKCKDKIYVGTIKENDMGRIYDHRFWNVEDCTVLRSNGPFLSIIEDSEIKEVDLQYFAGLVGDRFKNGSDNKLDTFYLFISFLVNENDTQSKLFKHITDFKRFYDSE